MIDLILITILFLEFKESFFTTINQNKNKIKKTEKKATIYFMFMFFS